MSSNNRVERTARLKWVNVKDMRVQGDAQRGLKSTRVHKMLFDDEGHEIFDPEQLGYPTLSYRDGVYYICDGQHRIAAYKEWDKDWETQQMQCQVYEGLTRQEEAQIFLRLNNTLTVTPMAKFKVALTAQQEPETSINQVVTQHHLKIGLAVGQLKCPGTLLTIWARGGAPLLGKSLRIAYDAFGEFGLDSWVLDGVSAVCMRYKGLDEVEATRRLRQMAGGYNALMTRATQYQHQQGRKKGDAVAGSIVTTLNAGSKGMKLPPWWGK
jgi:hypothetical protein